MKVSRVVKSLPNSRNFREVFSMFAQLLEEVASPGTGNSMELKFYEFFMRPFCFNCNYTLRFNLNMLADLSQTWRHGLRLHYLTRFLFITMLLPPATLLLSYLVLPRTDLVNQNRNIIANKYSLSMIRHEIPVI